MNDLVVDSMGHWVSHSISHWVGDYESLGELFCELLDE